MTIEEMEYDFKVRLNAIDSQKYVGMKIPEIDRVLNEARDILVKLIAQPRLKSEIGFEINQRVIDDIRTIVVDQKLSNSQTFLAYNNEYLPYDNRYIASLPDDYWFYVKSDIFADKLTCTDKKLKPVIVQHNDDEEAYFTTSSFEWRKINISFNKDGILAYTDGTFIPKKIRLSYIKKSSFMHNAKDFEGGSYNTLSGTTLTGKQDCDLPFGVHSEIVDIAVLIQTGNLMYNYQVKKDKLGLNI